MRLRLSLGLVAFFAAAPVEACWKDGQKVGMALGREYCAALDEAYKTGHLRSVGTHLSLCGDGSQGLACKTAMTNKVEGDRVCRRLYNQDYAAGGMVGSGYTARSLYDVYVEACREEVAP